MSKVTMCGIDAHDKTLVCHVCVGKETDLGIWKLPNTIRGRVLLRERLVKVAKEHGSDRIVMAYEASGLGFGLYDEFRNEGLECHVLAPTKIRKREDEKRKKSDVRDAKMILETIRASELAGCEMCAVWVPDIQTRQDRDLIRMRTDLGEELTRAKNGIRSFLKKNGIRKPEIVGEVWTSSYRRWLEELKLELSKELETVLSILLRRFYFTLDEIDDLDKAVTELSETERYGKAAEALRGIPGVGTLTAMVFLTQMGDLDRFENRRQVAAYIGLTPTSNESGEADSRKGRITRDGPGDLRKMLCQAGWNTIRSNGTLRDLYTRIVERNPNCKKKAIVAVMRKLSIRMWHVAKDAMAEAA